MYPRLVQAQDRTGRVVELVMVKLGGEKRRVEWEFNLRYEGCKSEIHDGNVAAVDFQCLCRLSLLFAVLWGFKRRRGGLCLGEVQGKSLEVTTALVGTELLECLGRYLVVAVCGTEGVRGSVEWFQGEAPMTKMSRLNG